MGRKRPVKGALKNEYSDSKSLRLIGACAPNHRNTRVQTDLIRLVAAASHSIWEGILLCIYSQHIVHRSAVQTPSAVAAIRPSPMML
jgi:hypothetical protein